VILGSGLGAFASELTEARTFAFSEIPNFPHSTVAGHAGQLVLGRFQSTTLAVMAGRVHAYEGYRAQEVVFPIQVLSAIGIRKVVLTNAAGAVNTAFRPGELMLITDHINLTGMNPLVGPEDQLLGTRFPDMTEAYSSAFRASAEAAARHIGLNLRKGVYAGLLGPSYETPAEIRMLRTIGADAVGMSTVLETIAANQLGMGVLGISCLTNMAAGILPTKLEHKEVMATGEKVRGVFLELLRQLLPDLAKQ